MSAKTRELKKQAKIKAVQREEALQRNVAAELEAAGFVSPDPLTRLTHAYGEA